jgi:hypothetical protein
LEGRKEEAMTTTAKVVWAVVVLLILFVIAAPWLLAPWYHPRRGKEERPFEVPAPRWLELYIRDAGLHDAGSS